MKFAGGNPYYRVEDRGIGLGFVLADLDLDLLISGGHGLEDRGLVFGW